jgi:lysozyme
MMQLGTAGTDLIQSFETLELIGYADEGGIPTAGWGHTGSDVQVGVTYTEAQTKAWFASDTADAVAAVNRSLTVAVTQNEFDALVAFTYNVGIGNEAHSTLLRLVNAGDKSGAAAEFSKWDHIAGRVSAGLLRRDIAERDLFLAV